MDALFVVPTLVSPYVNEKLVPALAKMVERNILLTYYSSFRLAVMRKYKGFFKSALSDSCISDIERIISEGPYTDLMKQAQAKAERTERVYNAIGKVVNKTTGRVKGEEISKKIDISKIDDSVDKLERPSNIGFYNVVSLEPTYLTIPITTKAGIALNWDDEKTGGRSERMVYIGIKCVPYYLDGVTNIVNMMRDLSQRQKVESLFKSKWNSIKKSIPGTEPWKKMKDYQKHGEIDQKRKELDIIFSPNSEDLGNPNFLKGLLSSSKRAYWSTLTVLSTEDFKNEKDMKSILSTYKNLVSNDWGDMIIDSYANEQIYFCMQKIGACYQMSYSSLKQIMKMGDILDYTEIKGRTPFGVRGVVPVRRALMDSVNYDPENIQNRILEIIQ
jgi:hypothetical protein